MNVDSKAKIDAWTSGAKVADTPVPAPAAQQQRGELVAKQYGKQGSQDLRGNQSYRGDSQILSGVRTEDLFLVLSLLTSDRTSELATTGLEQNKQAGMTRKKNTETVNAQMLEIAKRDEEATKAAGKTDVWGWVGAIAGLIGSAIAIAALVIAAPVSGGATLGLAVLVGVGAVMSIMDTVNMGLKEGGVTAVNAMGVDEPLDIGFGGMISRATDAVVAEGLKNGDFVMVHKNADGVLVDKNDNPVSDPDNPKYITQEGIDAFKTGMTIALTVVVAVVMIRQGYKVAGALNSAASKLDKVGEVAEKSVKLSAKQAANLERGANVANVGTDVVQGSSGVAQGAIGIETAEVREQNDIARAHNNKMQKNLELQNQQSKMILDWVRDRMADSMSTNKVAAQASRNTYQTTMGSLNLA